MHLPLQSVFRDLGNRSKRLRELEARVGIEPTHKGFADLSLTTWVPRPLPDNKLASHAENVHRRNGTEILERETGFEPATSTLARSHSTTELLPLKTETSRSLDCARDFGTRLSSSPALSK